MVVTRNPKRVHRLLGVALVALLLTGAGCDAVANMFGPWTGVYESDYMPDNDTANFQTLAACQAWGRDQVEQNGGSYQCGKNCKTSATFNTLDCDEVH